MSVAVGEPIQAPSPSCRIDIALAGALQQTCGVVEAMNRDRRCAIVLYDQGCGSIAAAIGLGLPQAFLSLMESSAAECFSASRESEFAVHADIAADPTCREVRDAALAQGLRSSWSLPVAGTSGSTIAVLTVFALVQTNPSPADLQAARTFATLIADTIERSRIDQAIRENLTRLELAHNIARLGYWERDVVRNRAVSFGRINDIVGQADAHQALDLNQLLAKVVPEDRHLLIEAGEDVAANRPHLREISFRIRQSDGEIRHVLAQRRGIRDESGRIVKIVGTIQDVTAQHRAAAELKASEERFRLMAEHTGQLIVDCDIERGEVNCAGAIREILGDAVGTAPKLPLDIWRKVVHPDDLAMVEQAIKRMLKGARISVACRILRFDGKVLDIEAIGSAVIDANGRATRVIGTLSDISDRRRAEAEGRRYLMQLAFLADAARKVNSVLSVADLLQTITQIARDLVGCHIAIGVVWPDEADRSELRSSSASEKYASLNSVALLAATLDESDESSRELKGAMRAPRTAMADEEASSESQIIASSGLLTVPLVTPAGRANGLIRVADKREGDFNPNDERVLGQLANLAAVGIENARLYGELEARVGQRTQELEHSNRELEAFSYSVSHDLRGPLRAISGFTGLLRERHFGTFDNDSQRYIERIEAGTQRMAALIDDLLELGRVTRLELKCEQVDLSSLAEAIVQRLRERSPQRAATFDIQPGLHVWADLRLLEIVLENLLDNAWKFTAGRSAADIVFGVCQMGADRAFLVRDNGVGFDPRYASNLFGVFQRLHATTEFPGTGVGLATVQRIVQRHGGRIWAEAEVDRGAVFYFTLAEEPR
ncbi:PAS domain S-box-containing protein [Povalibacter uvarum]|uniref:histidine kinase n=1 Tax=Povalibacter uvarum TaxID=732238 RepID=A0A841HFS1_9GAMM|nr:PAS domain-containing protein [Povalibacter uvarum]MBB6091616.1 PAS domain S-box-containing protein [Povalibacter uvarum]